uniref:Elongator complex protein 1 n=1 Tax=Kryptolebias marmoratus TaxID=37003 RepID=A0A3Q2ZMF9_KRYMA
MRNLKLLKSLGSSELQGLGSPQRFCVRADSGSLLVASQFSITEFEPRTGQVVCEASLTADGFLPEDGSGVVVGLQDLAELQSACLATAGGDVVLFNLNTNQLECVGSVDSGLTSMSWSPDEELVVLTTQETIIMMTKDFEPITEVGIHQDDFKFITVGWGKKETQFHGSEGKQAAQRKTQQVQPAVAWDDRRPRVTWRGDGQLFAISAICPQTRKVRVWNREGVLQTTSEPINGLEQALCWPSGNLITSTQRHPNKHSVVFMEKNGLLHGDFTLPLSRDQAKVKELLWNNDSTVLTVWLEDLTAGEDGHVNTYQLWTVGNYHWYLKQSLDFGRDPQKAPVHVCWDPERPLRLHVVTYNWTCFAYDWGWTTERSPGVDGSDHAGVAVIDGKVLVTTFRQSVVPPPMCSFELQLKSPVNQVTFLHRPKGTNQIAAFTVDGQISVFSQFPVPQDEPLALRQLLWLQDELFLAVSSGLLPTSSTLLILHADQDAGDTLAVSRVEVDGVVVSVVHSSQTGTVAFQLEDGQIRKLLWEYLLGLTDRSHLYAGDTENIHLFQLASNVCSFAVCDDFLLISTHSHTCRCLQLSTLTVKLQAALASDGGQNDETLRRVERGSRIVTVVPQDTRVVLQMPRGNLETVHHRALVLAQLRKWLDLRFREAFECMRKLRINLNLIYDHNPKVFLENIETFITQLNSINSINLFLTELEEDTSCSMYPRPDSGPAQTQPTQKKVDVVCDALRSAMESMDPNFCLSVLTAHVKKTVPELEIALQKVHELRDPPEAPGSVSAEEALKYLLFLVNVNDLYEHSLGTYDFDLVLMVAEKSQKLQDPKEYLPFLNMLKSLEPNYQRYTIDKHLKRYRKALVHLTKCGEEHFPEVLSLVKEQKLYSEALRLYAADSPQFKFLSCGYAEHLMEQQQAEQAGLLLWRCGEPVRALQAFTISSSWRNTICVAQQIPLPPDQLALLARDLAKLTEQRRYSEAALLLDQYAKIYMHNRQDITETNLKPALLEVNSQMGFLEAQVATFARHRNRLAVVREQKEKARLDMLGPDCPDAELYSEASSMMTASKYSQSNSRISRSSKNRRKAERKKLSLKEGSPMEDRALMHALGEILTTVDKMREIHSLLKALVLFQFDKQAEKLQLAYEETLQAVEAAVPEVWPEGPQVTGPNSTANSIMASFQQQQRPAASQQAETPAAPKMRNGVKWKLSILK